MRVRAMGWTHRILSKNCHNARRVASRQVDVIICLGHCTLWYLVRQRDGGVFPSIDFITTYSVFKAIQKFCNANIFSNLRGWKACEGASGCYIELSGSSDAFPSSALKQKITATYVTVSTARTIRSQLKKTKLKQESIHGADI